MPKQKHPVLTPVQFQNKTKQKTQKTYIHFCYCTSLTQPCVCIIYMYFQICYTLNMTMALYRIHD